MQKSFHNRHLGRVAYDDAHSMQKELWNARLAGLMPDTLLTLEHPHTITLGRTFHADNVLLSRDAFEAAGCAVRDADRGGDVTYHGPGQVVCYPIIYLGSPTPDVIDYLRRLEEVIILTLRSFGVRSRRIPGATGVWTSQGKIAAVGVKVTRGVTMHGFALNLSVDLSWYEKIIACGLYGRAVTSLDQVLGEVVPVEWASEVICREFARVFSDARALDSA